MKTWGDIFRQRLSRGEDHGSAAFAADKYVSVMERNHNPTAHDEMMRLLDECARLGNENAALRSLLREWYELFAPVRRDGTEGALLLDKTAEAMASEFRYKTPNVCHEGRRGFSRRSRSME